MRKILFPLLILLGAAQAYGASSEGTVALLSMESGAYMEAFSAFQAAYGGEVRHYDLSAKSPRLGGETRILVTFGGKAADYPHPEGISVVYAMAPGIFEEKQAPDPMTVKISLTPDFPVMFAKLKEIQPGLTRLGILWGITESNPLTQLIKDEGARQGIKIVFYHLKGPDSLPAALRRALGEADALWLAPDPLIVTPQNLRILREFSWDNGMPFYGSTRSMTREGAVASAGTSFEEMGKTAAKAALAFQKGAPLPETLYPEKVEITLNATAAAKVGITFPAAVLKEAGYLFP